jgi:glyceraldehyde-3-phosphate dehydrogenase (NADP+)
MLIGGERVEGDAAIDVRNPLDGSLIDTVPAASQRHVESALSAAVRGAQLMEQLTRHERASILTRAASLIEARADDLAETLSAEVGKTIREARSEVSRAVQTFSFSALEARRLAGEIVPFDAAPTGGDRFGFYIRVPVGVVVAITPFNFPLNLAAHKVAPAIAGGNAVILKPASATPLADIAMGEVLYEAGLPPQALSVITGSGGTVGDRLVTDRRPRMVTFTGSADVGKAIVAKAGLKKAAMELGSNSAVIITKRCDLEHACQRSIRGAVALAGQVCISVQRVLVQEQVLDAFLARVTEIASGLVLGDQLLEVTDVGPMIDEEQAARAERWVREAVSFGATVVTGGAREGSLFEPTVLTGVPDEASLWSEEAFAPVMAVRPFRDLGEAIEAVNRSSYGLQAGIYSDSMDDVLKAVHEIRCGGVMVNDVPAFRVDLMPYGGEKDSGLGREGPRYAIEEMTEMRVVAIRRSPP